MVDMEREQRKKIFSVRDKPEIGQQSYHIEHKDAGQEGKQDQVGIEMIVPSFIESRAATTP